MLGGAVVGEEDGEAGSFGGGEAGWGRPGDGRGEPGKSAVTRETGGQRRRGEGKVVVRSSELVGRSGARGGWRTRIWGGLVGAGLSGGLGFGRVRRLSGPSGKVGETANGGSGGEVSVVGVVGGKSGGRQGLNGAGEAA